MIIALSSLAQFSDTTDLNHYIRDSIKDRRPEKITAKQIQTVMFGLSKFLGVSDAYLKNVVHDSSSQKVKYSDTAAAFLAYKNAINKLVDSIAAHNNRIISLKTNLDSSKGNLRAETVAAVTAVQPYKLYAAEITQVGTSAPSSMVILNQLSGAISWSRNGVGSYTGTLAFSFPGAKTYAVYSSLDATDYQKRLYRFDNSSFFIEQRDFTGASIDGFSIYIEIKVYN